eukprot:567252-Amphidinium_carterae.2
MALCLGFILRLGLLKLACRAMYECDSCSEPDWVIIMDSFCMSRDSCPSHPGSDICYRQAKPDR